MSRSTMSIPRQSRSPRFTRTWALPVCLAMLASTALAQTAAETFAKAKRTEIQNASAKQALPLYELVAQSQKATDTLKARALYRLSICYLKLEEYKKASDTLARLETSYPRSDQAVQARLLRKTLGASEKALEPRRDIQKQVRELLLQGSKSPNSRNAALNGLGFLGKEAIPELRVALEHHSRDVQLIALVALSRLQDPGLVDFLIDKLDDTRYSFRYSLSRKESVPWMLFALCDAHPALWKKVKSAYENTESNSRAPILLFLSKYKKFDLITGFQESLRPGDPRLFSAAWQYYSNLAQALGRDDEYVNRLIDVSKQTTKLGAKLTRRLLGAYKHVSKSLTKTQARWQESLVDGLRCPDEESLDAFSNSPLKHILALRVRKALLDLSGDWMIEIQEGGVSIDSDVLESATVKEQIQYWDMVWGRAIEMGQQNRDDAADLLINLSRLVAHLDAKAFQIFANSICRKEVAEFLAPKGRSWETSDACQQMILQVFRNIRVDRLSTYLQIATQGDSKWLAALALSAMTDVLKKQSRYLGRDTRLAMKKAALRYDIWGAAGPEAYQLLIEITRQPGCMSVEEILEVFPLGNSGNLRALQRALGQEEKPANIREVFESSFGNKRISASNLYHLLGLADPRDEGISEAYKRLWPRLDWSVRRWILDKTRSRSETLQLLDADFGEKFGYEDQTFILEWVAAGGSEGSPVILRFLDSKFDEIKVMACHALGSLADPAAAPKLIDLLIYQNRSVREAAEKALESIRNIDKNQKAWRDWYESLKKKR